MIYEFDRYRVDGWGNRRKMAEGAAVERANSLAEASEIARDLFSDPSCKYDEFVLRQ